MCPVEELDVFLCEEVPGFTGFFSVKDEVVFLLSFPCFMHEGVVIGIVSEIVDDLVHDVAGDTELLAGQINNGVSAPVNGVHLVVVGKGGVVAFAGDVGTPRPVNNAVVLIAAQLPGLEPCNNDSLIIILISDISLLVAVVIGVEECESIVDS